MKSETFARRCSYIGLALILVGFLLPWATYTYPGGDGVSIGEDMLNGWAYIIFLFDSGESTLFGVIFSILLLAPIWLGISIALRSAPRQVWLAIVGFALALLIDGYFCLFTFNLNADILYQTQPPQYGPGLPLLLLGTIVSGVAGIWLSKHQRVLVAG